MASIEASIETTLFARLASFAAAAGLPVAWPNLPFTPPQGGNPKRPLPYLRVTNVPNTNRRLFLASNDPHQRLGLLVVNVFAPLNGGASEATEIAGRITEHFRTDLRMKSGAVTVQVERAPDVAQGMVDDAYWNVPVTVRYQSII